MRRISTKIVCRHVLVALAAVVLPSCADEFRAEVGNNETSYQVGFYAGGVQTRTEMLENGLSAMWTADDQIALWARNSSGSLTLSNQKFKTYGLDSQKGFFTSDLASAMPDGSYTYYSCYPVPVSVSGNSVSFNLPSVQDGKAGGGADIMIATPVQYSALEAVGEERDGAGMSMQMNRMMHQFRFKVYDPSGKLQGESVERINLAFPMPVAGSVMLDYTNPASTAVLSSGSKDVTLNLREPLNSDADNYACVALVPMKASAGESLRIKAYTADKIVVVEPVDLQARDFKAGHSTPVNLVIKEVKEYPYKMTFKVAANNLGEEVNTIVLTAPSGCKWTEAGSNVYRYTPGHKINAGEEFVLRFEDEAQYRAFSGKSISVTYDSDNALTYQTVTMPGMASANNVTASLTVPYLFFENFSGIPSFSDGHDNPSVGGNSDTYKDMSELSKYTSQLSGWYACRIGAQAGTAVRICCRFEDVIGVSAYYKGRLYTPFLSNIKDGVSVKISVSFRYGGANKEMDIFWSPAPNEEPRVFFGINTEDVVTNPDVIEGGLVEGAAGLYAGTGFASWMDTSMNPRLMNGETIPTSGGSYTTFNGTKNFTIDNVDNGMRLGWIVTTDNTEDSTNGNYWLYLDDIIVKIAQ